LVDVDYVSVDADFYVFVLSVAYNRVSIPYKALREAMVNAMCHREYQTVGGSIGLATFDDRVEVSNIGHFPNRIKMDGLIATAQSNPYNSLIA